MDSTKALLGLALLVGAIILGSFLFKKSLRALFGLPPLHQAGVLAGASVLLAAITPTSFGTTVIVYAILLYGFWGYVMLKSGGFKRQPGDIVVRGNQLASTSAVIKMLAKEDSKFFIGEVPIPTRFEPTNFLLAGAPGTGKSQTFHQILGPIRAAGEKAVIADVGGEFVARYYRDGDIIINPFDERSVSWSPLAEMTGDYDAERIAKSIIPDGEGEGAKWDGYAQSVVAAVLVRLWQEDGTNGELLRLLTRAPISELKEFIAGTPAEGMFAKEDSAMVASFMGIVASNIKPYQYLEPSAGIDAFSVRKFIAKEGSAWLFLNFTDPQFASLKPIISAVLDVASSAVLELKPSSTRRVHFALDEFATFGRLGSLGDLLAKGRKFGSCVYLGVQSVSQIFSSYGRDHTKTLLNCLGTQLILRSPDAETAEYFSNMFGEQDIQRHQHSTSSNGNDVSHSQSVQYSTQRVVMPSEIQNLSNLVGLLNVVGDTPPCVVNVPISRGEEVAERFIQKARKPKAAAVELESQPA